MLRTAWLAMVVTVILVRGTDARAQTYPTMAHEHVTIQALRVGLWSWLTPAERHAFDAIDTSGTALGATRQLMFLSADRIARVVLPLALEGAGRTAEATRLRGMPALIDAASVRTMRTFVATLAPMVHTPPRSDSVTVGPLGCDYPISWVLIVLQLATDVRSWDRADNAMAFCAAEKLRGNRGALVAAAMALVRDMAVLARSTSVVHRRRH